MNIEEQYQRVISEIEKGSRALVRFSSDEREELARRLVSEQQPSKLEQILCLIDHCATDDTVFEPGIIRALNQKLDARLMVFALNCARKHIVQSRFKRGQRLNFDFLEVLQKLLHFKNPEVVEWTLRTIEECGNQGVFFLQDFDKIKPPPWKWFNSHQRAVRELITMLERRWSRFEK